MLRKKLAVVGLAVLLIIAFSATAMAIDTSSLQLKMSNVLKNVSVKTNYKISNLSNSLNNKVSSFGSFKLSVPKFSFGTGGLGSFSSSKGSFSKSLSNLGASFAKNLGGINIGNKISTGGTSSLYKSFSNKISVPKVSKPSYKKPSKPSSGGG